MQQQRADEVEQPRAEGLGQGVWQGPDLISEVGFALHLNPVALLDLQSLKSLLILLDSTHQLKISGDSLLSNIRNRPFRDDIKDLINIKVMKKLSQSYVEHAEERPSRSSTMLRQSFLQDSEQENLQLEGVALISQSSYKKQPFCQICQLVFGKLSSRQHHCRVCANACCKDCSRKSINGKRACDKCVMQLRPSPLTKTLRERLRLMQEGLINLYWANKKLKAEAEAEDELIKALDSQIKRESRVDEDQVEAEISVLEKELEGLALEKAKVKDQIESTQRSILAKQKEYSLLKDQLQRI